MEENSVKKEKGAHHEIVRSEDLITSSEKKDVVVQNKVVRSVVFLTFVLAISSVGLGLAAPQVLSSVVNVFLVIFTGFFVIFLILGVAVLLGAKDRVSEVLSDAFEGTLRVLDFLELLKFLISEFVRLFQEVVLFLVPFISLSLSAGLYLALLYLFRVVGLYINPVLLIILLTVFAVSLLNFLNTGNVASASEYSFSRRLGKKFRRYLVDHLEVTIAVFFLTMDIEKHPLLPSKYWEEVVAGWRGIDFMARGFSTQHGLKTGLSLAGLAMFIEVIRRTFKILIVATKKYRGLQEQKISGTKYGLIKIAMRNSFSENMDDIIKFIGYSTVLLGVFMFLPRLKLLSMIAFSATSFLWDVFNPARIFRDKESEDLLTRLVVKTFKL